VAVARDGQFLWEEGFGWAGKEQKRAATAHTPYPLGSVSKPITATAVLVLRERGQLSLERPINDYLGDAKLRAAIGDVSGATLRRVIQHYSGCRSTARPTIATSRAIALAGLDAAALRSLDETAGREIRLFEHRLCGAGRRRGPRLGQFVW